MPQTYHLKDVNNYNTFFGTESHFQSITSLKLLKFSGLPVWNVLCPFLLIISQFPLTFFHHLHLVHKANY